MWHIFNIKPKVSLQEYLISIAEKDLYGDLKGFPIEVVRRMILNQHQQGNRPNIKVFQKDLYAGVTCKGFKWSETEEGDMFWVEVLSQRDFKLFFSLYPNIK